MQLRKSHEQFMKEIESVNNGRYLTHLTRYETKRTKVEVQCATCNHVWKTRPDNLLNGSACPKCVTDNTESFIKKLHNKHPNLFITDEVVYVNYRTRVKVACTLCGHKWSNTPAKLLFYGERCKYCFGSGLKTTEMFVKELEEKYPLKFITDKVEYKNTDTKVNIGCIKCSHTWQARPAKLLIGRGCPRCMASVGEKKVEEWLKSKGITFYQEHRFTECRDKKPLPFDFYIEGLKVAIEYDGIQHFSNDGIGKNGKRWGSHDLEGVKRRDSIKSSYCERNGIKLIRIPYTELHNLEHILVAELGECRDKSI